MSPNHAFSLAVIQHIKYQWTYWNLKKKFKIQEDSPHVNMLTGELEESIWQIEECIPQEASATSPPDPVPGHLHLHCVNVKLQCVNVKRYIAVRAPGHLTNPSSTYDPRCGRWQDNTQNHRRPIVKPHTRRCILDQVLLKEKFLSFLSGGVAIQLLMKRSSFQSQTSNTHSWII